MTEQSSVFAVLARASSFQTTAANDTESAPHCFQLVGGCAGQHGGLGLVVVDIWRCDVQHRRTISQTSFKNPQFLRENRCWNQRSLVSSQAHLRSLVSHY